MDTLVFRSSTVHVIHLFFKNISDWLSIVHIAGHHICLLIKCSTSTYCPWTVGEKIPICRHIWNFYRCMWISCKLQLNCYCCFLVPFSPSISPLLLCSLWEKESGLQKRNLGKCIASRRNWMGYFHHWDFFKANSFCKCTLRSHISSLNWNPGKSYILCNLCLNPNLQCTQRWMLAKRKLNLVFWAF